MEQWVLGGGLIALVALILVNNRSQDEKIRRNYQRVDEVKSYQDTTFTRQDICNLTHKQVNEKLDRMDAKLDRLLDGKQ